MTSPDIPSTALLLNDPACQASLVHSTSGQRIALNATTSNDDSTSKQSLLVGRTKEAALRIQHGSISRQHAVFFYDAEGRLLIQDFGGKHGTMVNGQRMGNTPVGLQTGDLIQFGKVRESIFRVELNKNDDNNVNEKEEKGNMQTSTTATEEQQPNTDTTTTKTTTSQDLDRAALEQAGQGLSGRAKRQAEIAAMMASLDQDITYTKVEVKEDDGNNTLTQSTTAQQQLSVAAKLPPQHRHLPVSGKFDIPSEADEGRLTTAVVDPPGSRFAVGRRNSTLSLYDYAGMTDLRRQAFTTISPQTDGQYPLQSLAYSPTGDKLLIGLASVQPVLLDRDGQFLLQFARGDMYLQDPSKTIGHTAEVTAVAWHALDKRLVFTASKDGSVRRWNVETGKLQFEKLCSEHVWVVKSATGRKTAVTSLALHPSGRSFAVGTSDGSIQVWSTNRTRPDKVVVAGTAAVTALCYTIDGTKLASRAADETVAKVWKAAALSRSAPPVVTCLGLPTIHETANIAFSPKGDYLVGGATAILPRKQGEKPTERGSLNFYHLAEKSSVEPCADMEMPKAGPVVVDWHPRWNQVLTACSDGSVAVYYDVNAQDQTGGVWTAVRQGRRKRGGAAAADDDLQALLRDRARQAGPAVSGEILLPLASQPKRRKKDEAAEALAKREPERPATGKHRAGGAGSGVTTFAQYIADQSTQKDIAGKDPREALLKYTEGKSYLGKETKILDTKTMEEEEEEEEEK